MNVVTKVDQGHPANRAEAGAPTGRTWSTPQIWTYDVVARTNKVGSTTDNLSTPTNS